MKLFLLIIMLTSWSVGGTSLLNTSYRAGITSYVATPTGSGVYMNAADYSNGKLSFSVDCKTEYHKIKLHSFLNKDYFDVIHQGEKHTIKKNAVYGIRDCEGKDWRFSGNKEYQILEQGPLLLYQTMQLATEPNQKGVREKKLYFFSQGVDGTVLSLTKQNLKKATANNHTFHDKLDAQFKNDSDLTTYDTFHKQYKVNHLLAQSLK